MNIFAHRGYSSIYPENTRAAFEAALETKVEGIEFDVHLTKDNEVVVIHDETIDRTSNRKGRVREYNLFELKKYDFGSFFNDKYAGEKILTLSETLDIMKNLSYINIEIKNVGRYYREIEKEIVKVLSDYNLSGEIIISSFNHQSLYLINNYYTKIKTAPLFCSRIYNGFKYIKQLGADYIHIYYKVLDRNFIDECHSNNIKVNAYTVNKKKDIQKMDQFGADGIITDYPQRAKEILKSNL